MKNLILTTILTGAMAIAGALQASAQTAPALLEKSAFETVVDGKPISLYTITNGRITAQITNFGGYVVGLHTKDKNGTYVNVVSHDDSIDWYLKGGQHAIGPALGRYANRIAGASVTLDGVEYQLTKNNGTNTIHGGAQGFEHTVWDVDELRSDAVVLSCTLADGLDGFPGNLKTTMTFSITEDDGLSISFAATTDKVTVCNLSHHAYFNLNGAGSGDVMDHLLQIDADAITEVDRALIPTGVLLPVEGTAYDFRSAVKLGDRQFTPVMVPGGPRPTVPEGMVRNYDNNFCLRHSAPGVLEKVAELSSPASGIVMEVLNDQPGLQVYSGIRGVIAMESQKFPDAPHHPEFESTTLRPGEVYRHTVIYRLSTR